MTHLELLQYWITAMVFAGHAFMGGFLIWNMRDDEEENFLGLRMKRWIWMTLALLAASITMRLYFTPAEVANWRIWIATAAAGFLWSYAHGPMLQGPKQLCSDTPDAIERSLMWLFEKTPGDAMGVEMWALYRWVRVIVPCAIVGFCLGSPLIGVIAGVLYCLGYWPAAFWITSHERTKYVGAGIAGAVFQVSLIAQPMVWW